MPFIARYRKEVTGALDDTQLRQLDERLRYLRELEIPRREFDTDKRLRTLIELQEILGANQNETAARFVLARFAPLARIEKLVGSPNGGIPSLKKCSRLFRTLDLDHST